MKPSRTLATAALALMTCSALLLWAASPAPAVLREGFEVSKDEPFEGEYPAMGPGAPTGAEGNLTTPASCGGAARIDCDTIPFSVVVPPEIQDDRDIFFVIVELSWDDAGGSNDLDLYLWDNGQETGTQQEVARHATADNPQIAKIANPDLGEYNVVVENFAGANAGYTIRAVVSTDPFTNPVEALAPEPPEPEEPEEEEEFEQPEDLSAEPSGPTEAPDVTLPPVTGAMGDDDFDFDFSDLDQRITVSQDDFALGDAPPPRAKETVNPAVLLASLVGAPALVVGSGAAFAWKRRRDLLI